MAKAKKDTAFNGLGYRSRSFDRFIESQCPEFQALKDHEKAYMAGSLWGHASGRFLHNSGDDDLIPVHWKSKQSVFGSADRFNEVVASIGWFVKETKAIVGTSAEGWAVTAKGKKIVTDYLQRSRQMILTGLEEPGSSLINADGTPYRMQRDGIHSRTRTNGQSKHPRNVIDTAVPIDGDNLHAFNEAADAWLYNVACPPGFEWAFKKWDGLRKGRGKNRGNDYTRNRVEQAKAQASKLLDIAKCSTLPGFIVPTRYIESRAGRLYAEGMLNMQRCYSEVRRAALAGCFDVDIENCHWALLAQMAADVGMATPAISYYLSNKKTLRDELALAAGITQDDAKFMLTAMIYGATLSETIPENRLAISRRIGQDAVTRALAFAPVNALKNDVTRVSKAVISNYANKTRKACVLVNDFGNEINVDANEKELLAHILQGAEACALKAMMNALNGDVLLLQHDGLTCNKMPNKAKLEDVILKETGYLLTLEIDLL